jgi:hypothetical protein
MYPVFGVKGSSFFLGVSEWLFGALLLAGFWNRKLGILGALGSIVTFVCTITIISFMPDGWGSLRRWISRYGWQCRFSDERCCSARCLLLPPEAGCLKAVLG